jgi:putative membrane protein
MSEYRRQHWAAAVDKLFNLVRKNLFTFLVLFFVGTRQSDGMIFWYVFAGTLVLAFVTGVLDWVRFEYRVKDGELQIKKGILVRNNLFMDRERIQTIDVTEGIIQRLFGLVKVEIKSAGSGNGNATLAAISAGEAKELQDALKRNRSAESVELATDEFLEDQVIEELDDDLIEDQWKISKRELLMAALTSGNFGIIASILGAISGQMDQFINQENLQYLLDRLPGFNNVTLIIGLVIVIFILSWGLSFLGVILTHADFTIKKYKKELVISSGLLERKQITIPFDRVQAVRFTEGVLRQPFGFGMLFVESAGFQQQEKQRSIVLAPYISKASLGSFFERFMPDFTPEKLDVRPPERAFFKYIRKPNYLLLVALPFASFYWTYGWMLSLLVVPFSILGWLRFRDAGLTFNQHQLVIRSRDLVRKTAFIRRNRIQVVDESAHPFQEYKNLSTVSVTTASGAKGMTFGINDMDHSIAIKLRSWLIDGKGRSSISDEEHE